MTPLVDAGCNMVIVTHLSDGSLWDRQAFPDTTILEIRPWKRLKYAGDGGNSGGLLSFTSAHTDAWRQQGYEDTMLAMEHIRKPLAARQALTTVRGGIAEKPGYNGRGRFGTEKRDGPD